MIKGLDSSPGQSPAHTAKLDSSVGRDLYLNQELDFSALIFHSSC